MANILIEPNFFSAASRIASASSRLSGRRTIVSACPPTSRISSAMPLSSSSLPDANITFAPRAPRVMDIPRPNAPDAPVTTAVCPETSNMLRGSFSCWEIIFDNSKPFSFLTI
jgi:hypothetical protein